MLKQTNMMLSRIDKRFLALPSRGQNSRTPVVKVASSRVGEAMKLRKHGLTNIDTDNPVARFEPFPFALTEGNKVEVMKTKVMPLHNIPYAEQLASKESYCRNALRMLARDLYKTGVTIRLDVSKLPCPIARIRSTNRLTQWRNTDEFSIWHGVDGKPTVGYTPFSLAKHGDTIAIEPNGCDSMRDESIKAANIMQEYIRNHTTFPVCYKLGQEGGWRRSANRINVNNELMVTGFLSPTGYRVAEVRGERDKFKEFIVKRFEEEGLKLASLHFQPCPNSNCPHSLIPYELLHGSPYLIETIGEYKFSISPETYFMQNSFAAKVLNESAIELIDEVFSVNTQTSDKPMIIDVNCGTGLMSTYLSKIGYRVIGVDKSSLAIEDARRSAELNKIENILFLNINIEIALYRLLEKHANRRNDTIVVCRAGGFGLGRSISQALRECDGINKIIYVTSKADSNSCTSDLMRLCGSSYEVKGKPFLPAGAIPVDIMPHQDSTELIIALERNLG